MVHFSFSVTGQWGWKLATLSVNSVSAAWKGTMLRSIRRNCQDRITRLELQPPGNTVRRTPSHAACGQIHSFTNPYWRLTVPCSKTFLQLLPIFCTIPMTWLILMNMVCVCVNVLLKGWGWTETCKAWEKQNLHFVWVTAACRDDRQSQWTVWATAGHGQQLNTEGTDRFSEVRERDREKTRTKRELCKKAGERQWKRQDFKAAIIHIF